ncbi:MAG: hypothetical protein U9N14_06175 [Pseudomonadota bacterium]|nr:hypothetical protein [Pseudomonadota bacterium]
MEGKMVREFMHPDQLEKFLEDSDKFIRPIGFYQLQEWVEWFMMQIERGITDENIRDTIDFVLAGEHLA